MSGGCQYLRLAELDQVVVGGGGRQAADVEVGLAQLLPASGAAATAAAAVAVARGNGRAVGARTGRSHGMGAGERARLPW